MTIEERAARSREAMLRYVKTPPFLTTVDHAIIDVTAEMLARYRSLSGGWDADPKKAGDAARRFVARKMARES